MTTPTTLLTPNPDGIPDALKARDQWVLFRTRRKANGKLDKIPVNARLTHCDDTTCCTTPQAEQRHAASVSDPTTWSDFATAWTVYWQGGYAGIGFVFTPDDPYFGLDLDGVIDDTGAISPESVAMLDQLDTYAEITPSGKGIHAIGEGELPPGRRKSGNVELYDRGRFFTMTGAVLPGRTEIRSVNGALTELHASIFGKAKPKKTTPAPGLALSLDDTEVLNRARAAANGVLFCALYDRGDLTAPKEGDGSQNSADLALCNLLRFWTGADPHQMDRIFRTSALYRPKWDEQRGELTYGQRTITLALTGDVYSPGYGAPQHQDGDDDHAGCVDDGGLRAIIATQAARIAELEATIAAQHRVITGAVAVLEAEMKPEAKIVQMGIAFRQHHGFGVQRPQAGDAAAELTAFYVHQPTEAERLSISTDAIQDVMNAATDHGAAFVKRDTTLSASPFTGEVLDQPHKFVAYVPTHDDLGETLHAIAATVPDELKKKRRQCRPRPEPTETAIVPPTPPICACGGATDRHTERADVARCLTCGSATQAVLLRDGAVLRPITASSGRGISPPLSQGVAHGSSTAARSGRGTERCPACRAPLKPDGTCGWAAAHAEAVPS